MNWTTIRISREFAEKLKNLKITKLETYEEIMDRKLYELGLYENQPFEFMGIEGDGKPIWRKKIDLHSTKKEGEDKLKE
jgi:hypothetical protein